MVFVPAALWCVLTIGSPPQKCKALNVLDASENQIDNIHEVRASVQIRWCTSNFAACFSTYRSIT